MLIVNKSISGGRGLAAALLQRASRLTLPWDARCRSRFDARDSAGRTLAVFLPRGSVLRGGDVLVAEDGSLVVVDAAPQAVMTVRRCLDHSADGDLLRAAYHLGNRHVAVELQPGQLQIEPDPVLADMLRGLGLVVVDRRAPFEPEAGAYRGGGAHGHAHDHARDQAER